MSRLIFFSLVGLLNLASAQEVVSQSNGVDTLSAKGLHEMVTSTLNSTGMKEAGTCVVDIMQATERIAEAALALNAASKNCASDVVSEGSQRQKLTCGQDITGVLTSVSYSASFLSSAAAKCGKSFKIDAQCSGDVSGFIASLSTVANAGIGIHTTCGGAEHTSQSSQLVKLYDNVSKQDAFNNASCFFDHSQALLYLTRAGLEISSAVKDCSSAELSKGEDAKKATCSTQISGVINSFVFMASYITMSIEHCPTILKLQNSKCAAAIINTVAGVAGVAATGSSFVNTCKKIDPKEQLAKISGAVESGLDFLAKKTS